MDSYVIVLLLVTQNEADILWWNIRHHLEWGVDHVAVADNRSTDATREVVRGFGASASYRHFDNFHDRQVVRTEMLDALRARHSIKWAGVADTDEFFWTSGFDGIGDLLDEVPDDILGVNFDMKLFLPTDLDRPNEPVFVSRTHRTSSSQSPLHTSYTEGKSFYRVDWISSITSEHWFREVPHERFRHPEPAVHHYMVQNEDQFVQKVTRLISWGYPPEGALARARWRATPTRRRPLPSQLSNFKKEWWAVYQVSGEAGVREYYRTVYTLVGDRRREVLAKGWLVEDPGFAEWARSQYSLPRE